MVKGLKITLNGPGYYYPGSVVSGNLIVDVDKPKKYKLIRIDMIGRADVHWTETEGGCIEDSHTVHYRNGEDYINLSTPVWQKESAPNGELLPWVYSFPFQYTLPHNIPPSFWGRYGTILYTISAKIQNSFLKFDHSTEVAIHVLQRTSIGPDDFSSSLSFEKEKDAKVLFGASQPIKFGFELARKDFRIGETIPLYVNVSNLSSRNVSLVASIFQVTTFYAYRGRSRMWLKNRVTTQKVFRVASHQIQKRELSAWNTEIYIPDDIPPTVSNCGCIRVDYRLKVKLKVPWTTNTAIVAPISLHHQILESSEHHSATLNRPMHTQQYQFGLPYAPAQSTELPPMYSPRSTEDPFKYSGGATGFGMPSTHVPQVTEPPSAYNGASHSGWLYEHDEPPAYNDVVK